MKKIHNKLVRDKIPQIISAQGKTPVCRTLSPEGYLLQLRKKLQEELGEFLAANDPEELADIYETADAIAELLGGKEHIMHLQREKRERNGAFAEKIFLEAVIEDE